MWLLFLVAAACSVPFVLTVHVYRLISFYEQALAGTLGLLIIGSMLRVRAAGLPMAGLLLTAFALPPQSQRLYIDFSHLRQPEIASP